MVYNRAKAWYSNPYNHGNEGRDMRVRVLFRVGVYEWDPDEFSSSAQVYHSVDRPGPTEVIEEGELFADSFTVGDEEFELSDILSSPSFVKLERIDP